jgi:hypothetical protein
LKIEQALQTGTGNNMQKETLGIIEAVLRTDSTISQPERDRLVSVVQAGLTGREPPQDRLVRRGEVARLLARSTKTIDRLADRGILKRVVFPTCKRGAGFRLSQIANLIAGGMPEPHGNNTVTEQ